MRTYSELTKLKTFEERFKYLDVHNVVGMETFGINRYLNQVFYHSKEWKPIRDQVITRDFGCDLGMKDYEIISGIIIVHHMNPITIEDIVNKTNNLLDPEFLITTSDSTHKALHYGTIQTSNSFIVDRKPNDTCPWK